MQLLQSIDTFTLLCLQSTRTQDRPDRNGSLQFPPNTAPKPAGRRFANDKNDALRPLARELQGFELNRNGSSNPDAFHAQTLKPGRQTMDLIRILLSILLPPLGVFLQVGIGAQFWLNILLTLLGYIPGIVHAVWIIATRGTPRTA